MIFYYILGIAVIGITTLAVIQHKQSQTSILRSIKKLCSIDSVQFEKYVDVSIASIKKYYHKGVQKIKKNCDTVSDIALSKGNTFRHLVRKKLHPESEKQESSIFIQTMKED